MSRLSQIIERSDALLGVIRPLTEQEIGEMAAYRFGCQGWRFVFYHVRVGGSPRRIDLVNRKLGKKYMIPFGGKGFDYRYLRNVPDDVVNRVKFVLDTGDVLTAANGYWSDIDFDQDVITIALGGPYEE